MNIFTEKDLGKVLFFSVLSFLVILAILLKVNDPNAISASLKHSCVVFTIITLTYIGINAIISFKNNKHE